MRYSLTTLLLAIGSSAATAASLAPNDPSISASLGLWLTDAANNYAGGTWSDSSGNGNDATTLGTVNVNAPVTYNSPSLDLATASADHNTSSVAFAGNTDDMLVTNDIFGGAGVNELTVFVAYHLTTAAGNPNLTRPAGIGSVAGTQSNPGDHFNLANDPSVRKDNGQIGSGSYSGSVTAGTPLIRIARMDAGGIDEWFNSNLTMNSVLSNAGAQFTTSSDDFFMGDLRGGSTAVPGFGTATSLSEFNISQVIVYNSALTDQQISDINEFMVSENVPEPGSTVLLGLASLGILRRRR